MDWGKNVVESQGGFYLLYHDSWLMLITLFYLDTLNIKYIFHPVYNFLSGKPFCVKQIYASELKSVHWNDGITYLYTLYNHFLNQTLWLGLPIFIRLTLLEGSWRECSLNTKVKSSDPVQLFLFSRFQARIDSSWIFFKLDFAHTIVFFIVKKKTCENDVCLLKVKF